MRWCEFLKPDVTFCLECKYAGWNFLDDIDNDNCFKHMTQDDFMLKIKANDFCSWAEKVD